MRRYSTATRTMRYTRRTFVSLLLIVLCVIIDYAQGELKVEKVGFKASYVEHGEKMARTRVSASDSNEMNMVGENELWVETTDTLHGHATIIDTDKSNSNEGSTVTSDIEQAMLRLVNLRNGMDNLYVMRRSSGGDLKVDINLKREIRSDREFWCLPGGADEGIAEPLGWRVEIILGDKRLNGAKQNGVSWTAIKTLKIRDDRAEVFKNPARGVFDFDVRVKKYLLPEYEFPLPRPDKRAGFMAVVFAIAAVILPLPILLMTWVRMGVLPISRPKGGKELIVFTGLQVCILAHIGALVMFWLKWNIVMTWKVMGVVMMPTLLLMRWFLESQ